jgi:hypothetical protein
VKKQKSKPTRGKFSILAQLCKIIPTHLVPFLARETGAHKKARTFSPWSHVVAMLYAQFTHALGLNDVCDGLRLLSGPLSAIRGATPPCKNTLSHANKVRDASLAEKLFWATLDHLKNLSPAFYAGGRGQSSRLARRFRRSIHIVDATVIQLVANCLGWAKHRRRKAAAKCHMRIDLRSFLPRFAVMGSAKQGDMERAPELCADLQAGEVVILDRGYLDFKHLARLAQRGVFFVIRAKSNLAFRVSKTLLAQPLGAILADELIVLRDPLTSRHAPPQLRRVLALVEVEGKLVKMAFLTNNLEWAPSSVSELYRCRWQIEVFFKQIKQTLQLADFLGNSANAVHWQLWSALLVYVLLRFAGFLGAWAHGFSRLWALIRTALREKLDLLDLLKLYGTADGNFRFLVQPEQAFFPAF